MILLRPRRKWCAHLGGTRKIHLCDSRFWIDAGGDFGYLSDFELAGGIYVFYGLLFARIAFAK
jgi:hypothetical protein